jgi:hypothetical protein
MNSNNHQPPAAPAGLGIADAWAREWVGVPAGWRRPRYRLDTAPANQVFTRNTHYLRSSRHYDFTPAGPARLGQELAWWIHTCWAEGHRKIEPSMLAWWRRAVETLHRQHPIRSLTDLDPAQVVRQAILLFEKRNQRLPSPGNQRNLASVAEHLHLMLTARTGNRPWWASDTWDLRIDPSIPRREHEPHADQPLRLGPVEPGWLREAVRFWLRTALTHQLLTWTTATTRARSIGAHFGRYCAHAGVTDPLISTDPTQLRGFFLDFLAHLRSNTATAAGRLRPQTANAIQSHVQGFYSFIHDHAAEVAAATGNPRWNEITTGHTRLWAPAHRGRTGRGNQRELSWIAAADLQRMLAYLDVLGAPTTDKVALTGDDGGLSLLNGLGDPQAMRIWLLQASRSTSSSATSATKARK